MNIIELAREADPGFEGGPDADGTMGDSLVGITAITRFAALVRAAALEEAAEYLESVHRTRLVKFADAIRALKDNP